MKANTFATLIAFLFFTGPSCFASLDNCEGKGFTSKSPEPTHYIQSSPGLFHVYRLQRYHHQQLTTFLVETMKYSREAAEEYIRQSLDSHKRMYVAFHEKRVVGFTSVLHLMNSDIWELDAFGFAEFADSTFQQQIIDYMMTYDVMTRDYDSIFVYYGDPLRMPLSQLRMLMMMGFTPERRTDQHDGEALYWRGTGNRHEARYVGKAFTKDSTEVREADDLDYAIMRLYLSQWYQHEKDVSELVIDLRKGHRANVHKTFVIYDDGYPVGLFKTKELEQTLVLDQVVLDRTFTSNAERNYSLRHIFADLVKDAMKKPRLQRVEIRFSTDMTALFDSALKLLGVYTSTSASHISGNKLRYTFSASHQ